MEKSIEKIHPYDLLPPFEAMHKGEEYVISANAQPLIDVETNRENAINGATIAAFELPSKNSFGNRMQVHLIDFGSSEEYHSVYWDSIKNEPLPGWGVTTTRFALNAVNFKPDQYDFGFSPLSTGETLIGRNNHYNANYSLGFIGDSETTRERLRVLSREQLLINISDDEETVTVRDLSRNGTGIILPPGHGEKKASGLRRRAVQALGALASAR